MQGGFGGKGQKRGSASAHSSETVMFERRTAVMVGEGVQARGRSDVSPHRATSPVMWRGRASGGKRGVGGGHEMVEVGIGAPQ